MDLESLDRRNFQRQIDEHVKEILARPVHRSIIRNAWDEARSKIKYYEECRAVASPDELRELDSEMQRLQARLVELEGELASASRVDTDPDPPISSSVVAPGPTSHADYVRTFCQVENSLRLPGESKNSVIARWLSENRGICRTQLTDYLAGRIKDRVGIDKCAVIEDRIRASAISLGLLPQSCSD